VDKNAQIPKDCLVHVANAPNSFAKIQCGTSSRQYGVGQGWATGRSRSTGHGRSPNLSWSVEPDFALN